MQRRLHDFTREKLLYWPRQPRVAQDAEYARLLCLNVRLVVIEGIEQLAQEGWNFWWH